MKKKYIAGLIICCLLTLTLVGCSTKKADTTTTTKVVPKTAMQILTDRVNQSDLINNRQDTNLQDLSTRITGVEARTTTLEGKAQIDLTPLTARVTALEGLNISSWASIFWANISDLQALNTYLSTRIASLESYNVSVRLASLEARVNASPNYSTPTPNRSTPTPTPILCVTTKPVSIYPNNGNTSMPNGSILFQWQDSNASGYEFWFGTNPASLLKIDTLAKDALFYPFPATDLNTYYFWRVVALSPCGNQSTMWWFRTQ